MRSSTCTVLYEIALVIPSSVPAVAKLRQQRKTSPRAEQQQDQQPRCRNTFRPCCSCARIQHAARASNGAVNLRAKRRGASRRSSPSVAHACSACPRRCRQRRRSFLRSRQLRLLRPISAARLGMSASSRNAACTDPTAATSARAKDLQCVALSSIIKTVFPTTSGHVRGSGSLRHPRPCRHLRRQSRRRRRLAQKISQAAQILSAARTGAGLLASSAKAESAQLYGITHLLTYTPPQQRHSATR